MVSIKKSVHFSASLSISTNQWEMSLADNCDTTHLCRLQLSVLDRFARKGHISKKLLARQVGFVTNWLFGDCLYARWQQYKLYNKISHIRIRVSIDVVGLIYSRDVSAEMFNVLRSWPVTCRIASIQTLYKRLYWFRKLKNDSNTSFNKSKAYLIRMMRCS